MGKNQLSSIKLYIWGHIKPGQGYVVGASDMRLNEYYIKIYCIWMNFIFMGLIPFVALIILNAQTLWSLQVSYIFLQSIKFNWSNITLYEEFRGYQINNTGPQPFPEQPQSFKFDGPTGRNKCLILHISTTSWHFKLTAIRQPYNTQLINWHLLMKISSCLHIETWLEE